MQVIFQDPYASLNPRMTVGDMLGEPLMLHGLARTEAAGAPGSANCSSWSGCGPITRVAIRMSSPAASASGWRSPARLRSNPADRGRRAGIGARRFHPAQVINLMRALQQRFGLAYIFISHDLAVVKHIADRIAVMYLGKIVETATTDELFRNPRHPYTRALLAAVPLPDPTALRERALLRG